MKHLRNTPENQKKIRDFYRDVCADMEGQVRSAQWTYGIYPTEEELDHYLEKEAFYVLEDGDGAILGCLALASEPVEGYEVCDWKVRDGKIGILHLFAVSPKSRHRGTGMKMLREIEQDVQLDAIHLDCVRENDQAAAMYRKAGFIDHGLHEIFYEDTGWIPYRLFEKVVKNS